jgi:pimeloyl-ACP methyl ester carboxylesterase
MTPPALVRELVAVFPRRRDVEIANAGHLVMLEQPEAFNAALQSALNDVGEEERR